MIFEFILFSIVLLMAMALVHFYPRQVEHLFYRIVQARRIAVGILSILFALVFIRTGALVFMFIGFAILLYIAVWAVLAQPHKNPEVVFQTNGQRNQ